MYKYISVVSLRFHRLQKFKKQPLKHRHMYPNGERDIEYVVL